ncbi:MAG: type I DNA topoisomerase [Paludibacteraceae bacterium]|nr:type I DNA topoisomerase [Paludibacteraceae bacterium]
MQKKLVIVESPAKAKTIERFLGNEYVVKSSMGHIRDLKKKGMGVDIEGGFEPDYEISPDKIKLVSELKSLAKESSRVLIASDEDREGESIAWHIKEVLGLKPNTYDRIVFHEITETAIKNAVANPRDIDYNMVDAQQARRVLDRIVGFEISPVLWKKVKPSLSAGRVQSVTVRLLVEREREINSFVSESFYKVMAVFNVVGTDNKKYQLKTELNSHIPTLKEAQDFLEICNTATFKVEDVATHPVVRKPAPPFTTSTLQQDAARKLGFSVSKTMQVAQRLYEAGKITYMRTDSVNLSDLALSTSKKAILAMAGEKYYKFRQYHTNSKGAQEAHEAIRPTYMDKQEVDGSDDEQKLYKLIWKRTIACQMADAQLESTTVNISVSGDERKFTAHGEVVVFDGFLKVYMESVDAENEKEETILPPLKAGQKLQLPNVIDAQQRFTHAPYRYNEASLVKQLETLGIGRPSTYAPTISTIQTREYVEITDIPGEEKRVVTLSLQDGKVTRTDKMEAVGGEKKKLRPTDLGVVVNDFLVENFTSIMDYNFTAEEEKNFDEIAEGNQKWQDMMERFYSGFHPLIEAVEQMEGRHVGEREIGTDPESGKPVFVKIGRFGPVAQIGTADDEEKPRFASLKKSMHLDSVTLEEVLDLFRLPREIGEFEGGVLTVAEGRFGPYVKHDGKFYSLKKEDDPLTITAERAVELITAKRDEEKNRVIAVFGDIQVLNGRYGPYIAANGKNYKIPKGTDAKTLTEEDCKKLMESQNDNSKNVINEFEGGIQVLNGRYGPYITADGKNYKIPKDRDASSLTLEDCKALMAEQADKPAKKTFRRTASARK